MDCNGGFEVSGVIDEVSSQVVTPPASPAFLPLEAGAQRIGVDLQQFYLVSAKKSEKKYDRSRPQPLFAAPSPKRRGGERGELWSISSLPGWGSRCLFPLSVSGR